MTPAHVSAKDRGLKEGMTPGGLTAIVDQNFQSVLSEISKVYGAVNRMVVQNVAGVISQSSSEDLQNAMFQVASNTTQDLADTISSSAAEAVEATRHVVQGAKKVTYRPSSQISPGIVRVQRERLMRGEPLSSETVPGTRAPSAGPPSVSGEAPSVNLGARRSDGTPNLLSLDEQFLSIGIGKPIPRN